MKLHYLLAGIAASALMAGAAQAQLGAGASPDTGVTENQSAPADPTRAQTGVPSVDSTRPTGAEAGQTNLPGGTVEGTDDAAATSGAATSGSMTTGASSSATVGTTSAPAATSAGVNASMGGNVQLITNGPVPDTPENRDKYGDPLSRAGKRTAPAGN